MPQSIRPTASRSTRRSRRSRLAGLLGPLVVAACTSPTAWQCAPGRAAALDAVLDAAVADGDVPGVVAVVTTAEGIVYQHASGILDRAANLPMRTDAIFDIASMTKPITSLAAMMLVAEGKLDLDAPAARYLPELAGREVLVSVDAATKKIVTRPAAREVTVRDLLRHTSGIGYSFCSRELLALEKAQEVEDRMQPLLHDPGARWTYGMSTAQVGWIVERISGMSLEQFFRERIFTPLSMTDTSFGVPAEKAARLSAKFRRRDGQWNHKPRPQSVAGTERGDGDLLSTAADYAKFVQLMLGRGRCGDVVLLDEAHFAEMTRDQLGDLTVVEQPSTMPGLAAAFPLGAGRDGFGLGFQIARGADDGRADGSLSWGGLFNTHFWIDLDRGVGVVLLTQTLPFYDPQVLGVVRRFERAVYGENNPAVEHRP